MVTSDTGGQKGLKIDRFDLIPPGVLRALAKHYGINCKAHGGKYDSWNWTRGYKWSWSYGALMRHLDAFWRGEDIDPDGGQLHITAVLWHSAALWFFSTVARYSKFDDRPHQWMALQVEGDQGGTPDFVSRPTSFTEIHVYQIKPQESDEG